MPDPSKLDPRTTTTIVRLLRFVDRNRSALALVRSTDDDGRLPEWSIAIQTGEGADDRLPAASAAAGSLEVATRAAAHQLGIPYGDDIADLLAALEHLVAGRYERVFDVLDELDMTQLGYLYGASRGTLARRGVPVGAEDTTGLTVLHRFALRHDLHVTMTIASPPVASAPIVRVTAQPRHDGGIVATGSGTHPDEAIRALLIAARARGLE